MIEGENRPFSRRTAMTEHSPFIVVGVDGSPGGRRALDWAVAEGRRRGATVQAVTAWHWSGLEEAPMAGTSPAEALLEAERTLDEAVDSALAGMENPPVVAREVVEGSPADVLVRASKGADMLVVGSHGYGRLRSLVLGSVSQALVRRATCPVVILPVPHEELRDQPSEEVVSFPAR
jgi:nucleotide-binding universal stress UspA family protein